MQIQRWNEIPSEQMNPLITRQVLNGCNLTMAKIALKQGSVVPVHHHVSEQITTLLEGVMRFNLAGEIVVLKAGESLVIPPNLPHSAETLEDAVAIDVFAPVREDWLRGDDAYLRR